MITFYTDGGAVPNPGFGGYGVYSPELKIKKYEAYKEVTNNQMEMLAVIDAYLIVKEQKIIKPVIIFTDSQYVVKGINEWKAGWIKKNWSGVKNKEIWQKLDHLEKELTNVSVQWVKGHNGIEGNEIADELATIGVETKSNKMLMI